MSKESQLRYTADSWKKSKEDAGITLPDKFAVLDISNTMKYVVPREDKNRTAVEMCKDPLVLELLREQGYRPRVSMH
jgi:hypothetical protein